MVAFNWKLMKEDLHGWTVVREWSDSDVEQAAKNMKNNPENYIDMIDVVSEFLPQPISDALWHNLSYTSVTQSNIRL